MTRRPGSGPRDLSVGLPPDLAALLSVAAQDHAGRAEPSAPLTSLAVAMSEIPSLIAEATRKSGLVWIAAAGARPVPTWHHWHDGAVYVIAGGAEQPLRGLDRVTRAAVTVRSKATGQRLVTWQASVSTVDAGSAEWDQVVPGLHTKRLNGVDGQRAPQRWASESVLVRLVPTGELLESPGDLPDGAGAAPPATTPAATYGPQPYRLGRPKRARRPAAGPG